MTSSPCRIRLAGPDDAEQVSSLIGTTWAKFFAYSVTPSDLDDYLSGPLSVPQITADILDPSMRILVAVAPGPALTSHTTLLTESAPTFNAVAGPKDATGTDGAAAAQRAEADTSGTIIGVVHLVTGSTADCLTLPNPIELRRLYVDAAHHGSGTAAALVRAADALAKQEGFESVWLGAWDQNARGIRFYEKMGWQAVGEKTFMVGQSKRRDFVLERAI